MIAPPYNGTEQDDMAHATFKNDATGIVVVLAPGAGKFAGKTKLVHSDVDSGNVVEVRYYPTFDAAVAYAKLCVSDTLPAGTTLRVL